MWGLVKQELKQFFSKGVIIFLIIVCLMGIGNTVIYSLGHGGIFEDIGIAQGRTYFQLEKERSKPYEGVINDTRLAEISAWYSSPEQDSQSSEWTDSFETTVVYGRFRRLLAPNEQLEPGE